MARNGLTPATWVPEASGGRSEEATIRPARLVEGDRLTWISVGDPEPWPGTVAFLDGIQRSEILAYAGAAPILGAEIAVAVRERTGRRLATVLEERRILAIGRPVALDQAGDAIDELRHAPLRQTDAPATPEHVPLATGHAAAAVERVSLPEDDPPHPVRDLVNAARALDRARGALEVSLGDRYRERSDGWLVVDGSLAESPRWAADLRMIGVSKSHATLPFDGPDLERYLRLPPAHRSSIFAPETRSFAPVHAWALRLWPWEGKDLFHGLVRVEVAPSNGVPDTAAAISRWLLAERAPVSTPDPRWDRLLYGIHSVEEYLRARR